ncbi:hypothetical protein ES332_D10G086900v1 [Gossypium tomentosum]|uniref:Uncharacterized protein n=1 Tax=Gossypium tomentosum TaxID=34277 RepID=A0A5D2J2B4_GOSTO|nr:hypothetical protein ES332_D10G086900v1 [Gossypium tomentosum]
MGISIREDHRLGIPFHFLPSQPKSPKNKSKQKLPAKSPKASLVPDSLFRQVLLHFIGGYFRQVIKDRFL